MKLIWCLLLASVRVSSASQRHLSTLRTAGAIATPPAVRIDGQALVSLTIGASIDTFASNNNVNAIKQTIATAVGTSTSLVNIDRLISQNGILSYTLQVSFMFPTASAATSARRNFYSSFTAIPAPGLQNTTFGSNLRLNPALVGSLVANGFSPGPIGVAIGIPAPSQVPMAQWTGQAFFQLTITGFTLDNYLERVGYPIALLRGLSEHVANMSPAVFTVQPASVGVATNGASVTMRLWLTAPTTSMARSIIRSIRETSGLNGEVMPNLIAVWNQLGLPVTSAIVA